MAHRILIYGPPGAGKDTQGERLSKALGIPFFSAGQLSRDEVAKDTPLGRELAGYLARGEIMPADVCHDFMETRVLKPCRTSGYVINGYPRIMDTLPGYLARETPTLVVHLIASADLVMKRLIARKRYDDTSDLIRSRHQRYEERERPVALFFQHETEIPYVEIDAALPEEEITGLILRNLKKK